MNRKLLAFILSFGMLSTTLTANAIENKIEPSYSAAAANKSFFDSQLQNTDKYKHFNDFEYYINENNTITITGYSGYEDNVKIPDNIHHISVTCIDTGLDYSWQAYSAKRLYIPESVTYISEKIFGYFNSLNEIDVHSDNKNYCSDNGVLFSKDKTCLISYPIGRVGNYTVPNGVAFIGDYAFYLSSKLTKINIPDGVKYIGNYAFSGCSSVTNIDIPDSVTSLGNSVFSDCCNLKNVSVPNSVAEIGYEAFYNCVKLTEITIPDGVTSLYDKTFLGCLSLKSITLSDNLTKIDYGVFINCEKLENISIPESVTSIGNMAFAFCSNLTEIYIPSSVESIGESTFAAELIDYNILTDSKNVTVFCTKDSYAAAYAKEHNIAFKYIDVSEWTGKSTKYGDIDGDGQISSADALLVLRYSVKLESFDDSQVHFSDVDGDGNINSADSLAILRYSVGYRDKGILIE